ncbi:MAG: hypothetical protein GXO07_02715, partial [Crenarchaeota archaeon]|nr:hypothetical protein [Thermoproteota archaeon]
MNKLDVALGAIVIGYLALLALTWLTPQQTFLLFLRVYLTLVNGLVVAVALWALMTLKKKPRPVPLPELEKEFEKELERLV